jgi:hypothetical protein
MKVIQVPLEYGNIMPPIKKHKANKVEKKVEAEV